MIPAASKDAWPPGGTLGTKSRAVPSEAPRPSRPLKFKFRCTAMLLVLRTVPRTRQQQTDAALGNDELGTSLSLSTANDKDGPVACRLQPVRIAATITAAKTNGGKAARAPDSMVPFIVVLL